MREAAVTEAGKIAVPLKVAPGAKVTGPAEAEAVAPLIPRSLAEVAVTPIAALAPLLVRT